MEPLQTSLSDNVHQQRANPSDFSVKSTQQAAVKGHKTLPKRYQQAVDIQHAKWWNDVPVDYFILEHQGRWELSSGGGLFFHFLKLKTLQSRGSDGFNNVDGVS